MYAKPMHTNSEVRNHERRRKKANPLGDGRSQAPGDPLRTHGKPGAQRIPIRKKQQGRKGSSLLILLQALDLPQPGVEHNHDA